MGNKLCCCLKPEVRVRWSRKPNSDHGPTADQSDEDLEFFGCLFTKDSPVLRLSDLQLPEGKQEGGRCSLISVTPLVSADPRVPRWAPAPPLQGRLLLAWGSFLRAGSRPLFSHHVWPVSFPNTQCCFFHPQLSRKHCSPPPFLIMALSNVSRDFVKAFGYIFSFLSMKTLILQLQSSHPISLSLPSHMVLSEGTSRACETLVSSC